MRQTNKSLGKKLNDASRNSYSWLLYAWIVNRKCIYSFVKILKTLKQESNITTFNKKHRSAKKFQSIVWNWITAFYVRFSADLKNAIRIFLSWRVFLQKENIFGYNNKIWTMFPNSFYLWNRLLTTFSVHSYFSLSS